MTAATITGDAAIGVYARPTGLAGGVLQASVVVWFAILLFVGEVLSFVFGTQVGRNAWGRPLRAGGRLGNELGDEHGSDLGAMTTTPATVAAPQARVVMVTTPAAASTARAPRVGTITTPAVVMVPTAKLVIITTPPRRLWPRARRAAA